MNSREIRAEVRSLLFDNAKSHNADYHSYMTACFVAWYFRDVPEGLSTVDQIKVCNYVHMFIATLCRDRPDVDDYPELHEAHDQMHVLESMLAEKLKNKGIISADDHGFTDDDELLEKHEGDFSMWAKEFSLGNNEEGK